VHAVRRNGQLASSIDPKNAKQAKRPQHYVAFQQRGIVAKHSLS
jgi:hypothetical protein